MSLSAERIAVANQAVLRTFAKSSVIWQSVPHWDVGDPGRVNISTEARTPAAAPAAPAIPASPPLAIGVADVQTESIMFAVTIAQADAATPDALLAAAMARTVQLAAAVDTAVLTAILGVGGIPVVNLPVPAPAAGGAPAVPIPGAQDVLTALLVARQEVEDAGYRAPVCLLASTSYYGVLNQYVDQEFIVSGVLGAAGANSLLRFTPPPADRLLVLGRACEIPHGGAPDASAGEEPVDLAVCVPPSLEVVGDNNDGTIVLAVRIRYAARVKDPNGIVRINP
jgi:hypothetical protein